jgi:hypothetical protein
MVQRSFGLSHIRGRLGSQNRYAEAEPPLTPTSFYRTGDSYAKVLPQFTRLPWVILQPLKSEIYCDAFIVRINHLIYRQRWWNFHWCK